MKQAYRAALFDFHADPGRQDNAHRYHSDGLLLIDNGKVAAFGDYQSIAEQYAGQIDHITDYRGSLICPGFIDSHIHYPQTDIIASPAPGLLPWLENYTFPQERKFADATHALDTANFFLDQLLSAGTTSAMVFCTVHPQSAQAFFQASHARNTRMIAGKVMMDRNCPDYLQDSAESGARDSEALIKTWHNNGRQLYALTPRFAPTSSDQQLGLCGELAQTYSDVYIQTHVAENRDEVAWVKELFPQARSYLDVYRQYGLLRPRAMYAHCIWLDQADRAAMGESGAAASICPTSNLFLGSGLFDFAQAQASHLLTALGSDVGGGTSFSMLQTMNAAYKVARMNGHYLSGLQMFYYATLGAARALQLENVIGNFAVGAEADFIVLDASATPLLARRSRHVNSLEEQLFLFALLGDDRAVAATYIAGVKV